LGCTLVTKVTETKQQHEGFVLKKIKKKKRKQKTKKKQNTTPKPPAHHTAQNQTTPL